MNATARSEGLFDSAVAASRLAPLIAPFTMTRLLVRANVAPRRMTAADLERALPTIEDGLGVYLQPEDVAAAMADLRALAAA